MIFATIFALFLDISYLFNRSLLVFLLLLFWIIFALLIATCISLSWILSFIATKAIVKIFSSWLVWFIVHAIFIKASLFYCAVTKVVACFAFSHGFMAAQFTLTQSWIVFLFKTVWTFLFIIFWHETVYFWLIRILFHFWFIMLFLFSNFFLLPRIIFNPK